MKITAQEEFGLRVLIRIAGCKTESGMSIPQLSKTEGLTSHYVAKLTRILRMAGFINSFTIAAGRKMSPNLINGVQRNQSVLVSMTAVRVKHPRKSNE